MRRFRLLDLFCGAGGAAVGYHRAGFEVVGVDIKPQPRFPFEFHQADALTFTLDGYDVIHASPPCQAFTCAQKIRGNSHPNLLTPIRERLSTTEAPWIIENVPGAPMRVDLQLCGSQFKLPRLRRHRWFEFGNWKCFQLMPCCCHRDNAIYVFGKPSKRDGTTKQRAEAMGIAWMDSNSLSEAIPPAYTEWIGKQLMRHLEEKYAKESQA